MTDGARDNAETPQCPECGGEVVKGRSTQKYVYRSCVDCEWYEKVEDGEYR